MAVLRAHAWPGNVRELRNVIERALLLCDGPALLPEHLPQPVPFAVEVAEPAPARPGAPPAASAPATDERARVLAALAACAGNQSRAARQLGISRKVLIARLDRYGVARPRKPGAPVSDRPSNGRERQAGGGRDAGDGARPRHRRAGDHARAARRRRRALRAGSRDRPGRHGARVRGARPAAAAAPSPSRCCARTTPRSPAASSAR